MIDPRKLGSAFYALNTVLVLAREMAYDGRSGREIAEVLDIAEYLPKLMAEPEDHTVKFRDFLEQLVSKDRRFGLALERFDNVVPPRW